MSSNQIETEVDGISYLVDYEYGVETCDGDFEEHVWVEVTDCHAYDKDGNEILIRMEDTGQIEENCRKVACEALGVEY